MKKAYLFCLPLIVSVACTKSSNAPQVGLSAEAVVKSFVELSAGAKDDSDKRKLQELCSGEMRRTFERMNEEAFKLIYLDSKTTITEFKIIDAKEEGDKARVAYQVTVDNRQGTDPTQEVNQREVDLAKSQGAWFIQNIRMRGSDQVAFTRGMLF